MGIIFLIVGLYILYLVYKWYTVGKQAINMAHSIRLILFLLYIGIVGVVAQYLAGPEGLSLLQRGLAAIVAVLPFFAFQIYTYRKRKQDGFYDDVDDDADDETIDVTADDLGEEREEESEKDKKEKP